MLSERDREIVTRAFRLSYELQAEATLLLIRMTEQGPVPSGCEAEANELNRLGRAAEYICRNLFKKIPPKT